MKRKAISLKNKLASALLQMLREENGKLVRIIPHDEAVCLTADEIISRFDFHHYPIPHAHGGPDEPWNLDPVLREEHRKITAKRDIPMIAKTKRIQDRERGIKKPSRIRSRGFAMVEPQRSASRGLRITGKRAKEL